MDTRNVSVRSTYKYYAFLVLAMSLWGLAWPVAKILVTGSPPLLVGSWRFLIASLFFLLVTIFHPDLNFLKLTRSSLIDFVILGLLGIFGYGILFLFGLQFTTSALGAIIAGVNPAVITLLAFILYNKRLKRGWQYSGLVISFLGVIFVIGVSSILNYQPEYLLGNILILIAMFCWGLYSNIGSKVMESHSSFTVTSNAVYVGAMMFTILSLVEGSFVEFNNYTPTLFLGTLFLGAAVTCIGFFLYFLGIQNVGASQAGIFINLVPIFGSFFSWVILKESIHWTFIIGLLLIISGIFIINYPISSNEQAGL